MKTSTTNLLLVLLGLALITIGLLRQCPIRINKGFWWNVAPMGLMFILVLTLVFVHNHAVVIGSNGKVLEGTMITRGVDGTMQMSSNFLITIVLLMPLIAFSAVLTPVFKEKIEWLLSGWSGWFWTLPLSFTSAGGSGFSGVVMDMWKTRYLQPVLLYFLTTTPLLAYSIFQIRALGLGTEIANRMYTMNWVSAVWLLPLFVIYGKFFFKA